MTTPNNEKPSTDPTKPVTENNLSPDPIQGNPYLSQVEKAPDAKELIASKQEASEEKASEK